MPLFEITRESLLPVARTTMQQQAFHERHDLQRLLKDSISILGEDLFVLTEEFSSWEDSRRRVDLLAVHKTGALVVIELKRTEDGGHMELQAVRYAAMVSTMTFKQAVLAHAKYQKIDYSDAEVAILEFFELQEEPETFGHAVRIVLVSPDFSRELTTAVLWLNASGLDIRCIRLRPYQLNERTLLDIEQVIPLPEAEDYTVRLKEKADEQRAVVESTIDFTRYDLTVNGQIYPRMWKRNLIRQVVAAAAAAGLKPELLASIIPTRKLVVVDGSLRGEDFATAAAKERAETGYVFNPKRLFMDDDQLIDIGGKTVALSNQWGRSSLPLLDRIIAAVPSANISYTETDYSG